MKLAIVAALSFFAPFVAGVPSGLVSPNAGGLTTSRPSPLDTECTQGSTVPNPIVITIPVGSRAIVSATVESAGLQRVTVVPSIVGFPNSPFIFQGVSPGVHKSQNIITTIPPGSTQTSLVIAAQSVAYTLSFTFQFSTDGGNSFLTPIIQCPIINVLPGVETTVQVGTEDGTDGDFNDTIAFLTII